MAKHGQLTGSRAAKIRAHFQAQILKGAECGDLVKCWRCGKGIGPLDEWDIGHRVDVVLGGELWNMENLAPEHRRQCNRSSGGRLGNERKRSRRAREQKWV